MNDRIKEILATAPSIPKDDKTQKGIPAKRGLEEKRKEVRDLLTTAFLAFLSRTLGFATETFEMGIALGMYGLDSLSAVSVQYWVWRGGCLISSIDLLFFFSLLSSHSRLHSAAIAVFSNLFGSSYLILIPNPLWYHHHLKKNKPPFSRCFRILSFLIQPFPLHRIPQPSKHN